MSDVNQSKRFEELLGRLIDDEISPEQLSEFTALVKGDADFSAELRLQLLMDDHLAQYENQRRSAATFNKSVEGALDAETDGEQFVNRVVQQTESIPPRSSAAKFSRAILATAIAASLMVAMTWLVNRPATLDESTSVNEELLPGVAIVENLVGELTFDSNPRVAGDSVGPGVLDLDSGYMSLEFYKGARLAVAGPAKLELVDPQRVICRYGKIRVTVPALAKGFTVVTAESEIVDLGTEFAMVVGTSGQTEVHVFDGEVEAYDADRNPQSMKRLAAGRAMRIKEASKWEAIPAESERFDDLTNLGELSKSREAEKLQAWREVSAKVKADSRLIAYYDFEREPSSKRTLVNRSVTGRRHDGAIIGARWKEGPWPGKASLAFKRPADRVRINLTGEYENITLAAWVRVDGLDRQRSSLLLTDGYDPGGMHWQFRNNGDLTLGLYFSETGSKRNMLQSGFMDLSRLGRWFHLVTVIDQSDKTVSHYLDGMLLRAISTSGRGKWVFGDACIGNWDPGGMTNNARSLGVRSLNGAIAELMIFKAALGPEEVKRLSLN